MTKYTVWNSELGDYARDPGAEDAWTVVYLASDVDAREAQSVATIQAQRSRIAELEREIERRIDAYRMAHEQATQNGARAAELEKALRGAIEWNWMDGDVPMEAIEPIAAALGVPATEL